jgi:hypothetical protein
VLQVAATLHRSRGGPWGASPQGIVAGGARMLYSFDDYTLDPDRYELRRAGRLVLVEPQALDALDDPLRPVEGSKS